MNDTVAPSQPAADERRREFWQTILAMGFDASAACAGSYSGVRLDAQVFETGIFHAKAAELLLHFLLTHLDSARAQRDLADCWPIADPRQARGFRTHVFRWLDELRRESLERQDGRWPGDVPVRRSFVDEGRGVRFESMMWALARVVAVHLVDGPWRAHLARPGDKDGQGCRGGRGDQGDPRDQGDQGDPGDQGGAVACRERYARRTSDRLRAQRQWQAAKSAAEAQTARARGQRDHVHRRFRTCRHRMARAADVPAVDASAEDIERALERRATEARALWERSAGWVERHAAAVATVDSVVERRANNVRLDRSHVRVAPAPQLANEWARWLGAEHVQPFRGASVDLHAVVRMAGACVGALRGALSSPTLQLARQARAEPPLLPDVGARLVALQEALAAQSERVERLGRLKARLGELQRAVGGCCLSPPAAAGGAGWAVRRLAEAAAAPVDAAAVPASAAMSRALQLARRWDDLAGDVDVDVGVDAGWPGVARLSLTSEAMTTLPVLSTAATRGGSQSETQPLLRKRPALFADGSGSAKHHRRNSGSSDHDGAGRDGAGRDGAGRDGAGRDFDMLLCDDGVPDFLVG